MARRHLLVTVGLTLAVVLALVLVAWALDSALLLVAALVFGGLAVLVFAGSAGYVGFLRTVDREGQRVRSGRWPRR